MKKFLTVFLTLFLLAGCATTRNKTSDSSFTGVITEILDTPY